MLNYNEILPKKYIVVDNEPYEVVEAHIARTQQRKPQNQTKIKNLLSGKVIPATFHASDKVPEADIETREVKYLYTSKNESWFCDPEKQADRFALKVELLEGKEGFLKANSIVTAVIFDEKIIGVRLPIKVDLLVKEAAPAVRGNTATGASKQVVLETGATVLVPLFINEGDVLRINTESGEYTERVGKNNF
jgi:elongation factor P